MNDDELLDEVCRVLHETERTMDWQGPERDYPRLARALQAAGLLRDRFQTGYLVAKIPECKRKGRGHGRHTLITRSANCPGEEPMPHGASNGHFGLMGYWVYCACGSEFQDYPCIAEDEETGDTPWKRHAREHNIGKR